ncbi:transposase [Streptomyces tauricus]|uniref:transposase n=1 Tax=Streptomyces tauricus TaxID=68274 RepID=UPI003443A6C5
MDTASLTPAHVERAQRVHGITPGRPDPRRPEPSSQSKVGLRQAAFTIDWVNEQAICPRGATSVSWTTLSISGHTYLQVRFAERDCRPCPDRARCTSSATRPRSIAVLLHEIQMRNRLDQQTEQWQRRSTIRAGLENTLYQSVRVHGLRRARYRGPPRTHVQHVLTDMACNLSHHADSTPPPPHRPAGPPASELCVLQRDSPSPDRQRSPTESRHWPERLSRNWWGGWCVGGAWVG